MVRDAVGLRVVVVGMSVLTFLAAAKAHGRQVRLERERAGYRQVVFGGENPAFVEALWRRDRVRWWSTAGVVFALGLIASRWASARGGGAFGSGAFGSGAFGTTWSLLFPATVAAFTVCGVLSLAGFVATREVNPAFTRDSLAGSAAWWSLVVAAAGTTFALAR